MSLRLILGENFLKPLPNFFSREADVAVDIIKLLPIFVIVDHEQEQHDPQKLVEGSVQKIIAQLVNVNWRVGFDDARVYLRQPARDGHNFSVKCVFLDLEKVVGPEAT